ncbi:MAG: GntR family transcriptional regulator [Albidovulum sp.]|nr:GntR family transcriptional regulator [Albidovulum sp.]
MPVETRDTDGKSMSLRQIAYRRFKEALFSGRIKPGDFLSQREICKLVDVPLSPVREALKSLETEGIATLYPKRGIRIIQIDQRDFAKAIEARKVIEGEAVSRFASHAPMEQIDEIDRQTLDFARKFKALDGLPDGQFAEKNRVDLLLHDSMMAFLDNPMLTVAFQQATEHVRIFRLNIAANQSFFELPAINEHLMILKALKERDAEAARALLETHLDGTFRRAIPGLN